MRALISHPLEANLQDQVRLLGYDLASTSIRAGDPVSLTLYWQCVQDMDTDYTVFVHVVNPEDDIVGQWDSTPHSGELPTTTWVPGEVVEDVHEIPMAPEAGVGRFAIRIGMYDAQVGRRLAATDAAGGRWPDDRILLGSIDLTN